MDGIILVNKEIGMSSHDVIFKLRKILKTKKIGHCGTLDPMASGVLVCLVGQATKLSNFLILDSKEYQATFQLGVATTTQDLEGEVIETKTYQNDYTKEDVLRVLENFIGQQKQLPSIYSAIKVNGKKLYEYARNNEEVEIPTREINIYNLALLAFVNELISIRVLCSSGTYIRSLCFDIAKSMGYPGVLTKLERTKSGVFELKDAAFLKDIEAGNYQLISLKDSLSEYTQVELNDTEYQDVRNGKPLKMDCEQEFVVLYNNEVQAIYGKSSNGQAKIIRGLW